MSSPIRIDQVEQALSLPDFDIIAARRQMAPLSRPIRRDPNQPGEARISAVLILLFCRERELHLVLTRRRDDLNAHAGQISFPGGRQDEGEALAATAVREAQEEVGVSPAAITLIGRIDPLYIPPSDFEVHPFVGWYHNGERPSFTPSESEVAEVLEVPLRHLLRPETRVVERWNLRGAELDVPFYDVYGHKVWGATAIMLSEFLARLRAVS
ncbi:MAG: NUDIX hydrolase [Anaerolineae bacterium]